MEVYSDRQLAKDQAARLRQGFSAYAETNSLASLIKKNFNHTISKSTRTLLISAAGSSPSQMNTKREGLPSTRVLYIMFPDQLKYDQLHPSCK